MDPRELLKSDSNIYLVGSQMYGLNTAESDEDFVQVYFDKEDYVRPFPLYPEEVQLDNNNYKVYSLVKFARLLVKGNPNIVEIVMETPYQENSKCVSDFMEEIKPHVVHRGLSSAFMGHLNSILAEISKKGLTPKRASHAIRVQHSLENLLRTQKLVPYRDLEGRAYALGVKSGEISIESAYDYLISNHAALEVLFSAESNNLPDHTELKGHINAFFKGVYK